MEMQDTGISSQDGGTHCDPCENEGRYIQAEGYCVECDDYLCKECLKIHRRPVLWRYHVLAGKWNMPTKKSMKGLKDDCVEPCSQHPRKTLEYFCHSHDCLACSLCVFRNHRRCDNVDYIPDIAELFFESEEMKVLNENFACLLKDIESGSKLAERGIAKIQEFQLRAFSKINMLRLEIGHILDKLSQDIIFMGHKDCNNLRHCNSIFNQIAKEVKTQTTVLEKQRNERKLSQLFVEIKLSKKTLKRLTEEVKQTRQPCRVQKYDININERTMVEVRKCLKNVCKLDVSEEFLENKGSRNFAAEHIISTGVSNVKSELLNERIAENNGGVRSWKDIGKTKVESTVQKSEHEVTPVKTVCDTTCRSEHEVTPVKTVCDTTCRSEHEVTPEKTVCDTTSWADIDIENGKHEQSLQAEDQCTQRPSKHSSIRQYDRETLLKLRTTYHALHKSATILDVPDIVFNEPQEPYLRWMKIHSEKKLFDIGDFRPQYMSSVQHKTQKPNETKQENIPPKALPGNVKSKLHEMIVQQNKDDASIIEWIDNNVGKSGRLGTAFVSVLMENVCRFSSEKVDGGFLFHADRILERRHLLHKYIAGDAMLEQHAVQALQNFVEKHKHPQELLQEALGVLIGANIISKPNKTGRNKIKQCLYELIVKEKQDNQSVIDWIESHVSKVYQFGVDFVNILTDSICRYSSRKVDDTDKWTFHPEMFLDKKPLLLKYINSYVDMQAQVLLAVQAHIERFKHPPDKLRQIFDVLYGAKIVTEDAFFQWEASDEKPAIRAESLEQVRPFFNWLRMKDNKK